MIKNFILTLDPKIKGLVLLLLTIFLSIIIFSFISFDDEKSITKKKFELALPLKEITGYFLYPLKKLTEDIDKENVVNPEKIDISSEENQLNDDIKKSQIFNRDDEIIQMELNNLDY